jgi:hypothetical protein
MRRTVTYRQALYRLGIPSSGHAIGRAAIWPTAWIDPGQASIFDADLLAEHFGFLLEPVVLGGQAYPDVAAVGCPAASGYDGVVGQ